MNDLERARHFRGVAIRFRTMATEAADDILRRGFEAIAAEWDAMAAHLEGPFPAAYPRVAGLRYDPARIDAL